MRPKYIEEEYPLYYISGYSSDGSIAYVESGYGNDVCAVSVEEAQRLIDDRRVVVEALIGVAMKFSECNHGEFTEYWYSKNERGE